LLGDCAFSVMSNDKRQAYIGITLARPFWGKGYAEEASRGLLNYLFVELNLHRVVAECDVENSASIILLSRLGFRREAHLIENIWFKGSWGSEFHYALLEREWKNL
jgi:ribosomal-protein-alanine N-acetyltransferase